MIWLLYDQPKPAIKENRLYKPSLFRRVWKIWAYNTFWSIIFFTLFWANYTIEELCWELDWFFLYGFEDFRIELLYIGVTFWFMFRQFMKDCNLIKFTYLTAKHDEEIIKKGGYKRIYEGPEGNGKTLNAANDLLYLACDQDYEMRLRYYLKCPFADELKDDVDFKILKESYEFYEANPDKIPHLMANFKLKYKNREQYTFYKDYIDQKRRIAEGFVCGLTEVGNIYPNSWGKMPSDESKDPHNRVIKNEFFSLSRQYAALKMVLDEQRTGEVYLGLRSVMSSNRRIEERRKVLSPHFLIWLHKHLLETWVFEDNVNTSRRLSRVYSWLFRLIEDIGFYEFTYKDKESIEDNVKKEGMKFVISCDIPFEFDTRGERVKYRLYSKSPEYVVPDVA